MTGRPNDDGPPMPGKRFALGMLWMFLGTTFTLGAWSTFLYLERGQERDMSERAFMTLIPATFFLVISFAPSLLWKYGGAIFLAIGLGFAALALVPLV